MNDNRAVFRQFLQVALGEAVCVALMLGVYALAGFFTNRVLIGAAIGFVLAALNFFVMSINVSRAADYAVKTGEATKATVSIQGGTTARMAVLAVIYILILKNDICDPLAAILPLLFVRISIVLVEFFTGMVKKNGDRS